MLADGAVGSELIKAGIAADRAVEANLSHPECVRNVHRRAVAAGAEILTANTFGMSASGEWAQAFQAGAELAEAAAHEANRAISVMISVFPSELLLKPDDILGFMRKPEKQGSLLLIETATDIREAVAAVAMARSSGIETIAATCHFQPDTQMPDGTSAAQAAAALQQAGASIVGANCGTLPEEMVIAAEQMRAATDLPLLFQPNAGLPHWNESLWVYPVDTVRFAANAAALFAAGAAVVGGCCGTTPAHIAAVHRLLFHPQRRE